MHWIFFSSLNGPILKMNSRKILGLFIVFIFILFFIVNSLLLISGYTEYNSNDQAV